MSQEDLAIWKCNACNHEWQAPKDEELSCGWCGAYATPYPVNGSIDYILIHPGNFHTDDALCVGMASHITGVAQVYRREPTKEELEDVRVLVLDVGGKHEPHLNNFDHHQLPKDNENCAFVLYCQHVGVAELLEKHTSWFKMVSYIDTQGPDKAAKLLELPKWPKELVSPILTGLMGIMAKYNNDRLPRRYVMMLTEIVENILEYAQDKRDSTQRIKEMVKHVSVNNVAGMLYDYQNPVGLNEYRNTLLKEHNLNVGFVIMRDDRGPGWVLYRYDDDKRIDFSKLKDHEDIHFAHANGFIAKTNEGISMDEALELVKLALTDK